MNQRPPPDIFLLSVALLFFGGCAHSPTLDVYGSYFPAWIVCIVTGIVITVIARLLLVAAGINEYMRFKQALYCCMAVFFTLAVWLIFFKG
jgi:hypothetical protein